MAKNKNDLVDFGEEWNDDDDFNMDSFDSEINGPPDNRSTSRKVASGVRKGALSKAGAGNLAKGLVFSALPKSYENAYTEVGRVKSELDSIYSSLKKDADPVIRSLKSVAGIFSPITNMILPKKLASKLLNDDGYSPDYGNDNSADSQEDSEVANAINSVFGAVASQNDSQHRDQLAGAHYDRLVGKKQFEYSAQHQGTQSELLSRLVGYQDSVTNAYYKKSLELQYRQHYSLKSLLNVTVETAKVTIKELQDIAHNSGLPNEVKITDKEIAVNRTKHLLIGKVQERFTGGASSFLNKFRKGAVSEIQDILAGVGNALNTAETMGSMSSGMGDISSVAGGGIGEELMGVGGRAIGAKYGSKLRNRANQAMPGFDNNVTNLGNKLGRWNTQWPAMISDKMRESNGQGLWGLAQRIMGYEDSGTTDIIKHDLANEATEAVPFDVLSRRTLIDIIPGFLSRQLQTQDSIYNILTGNPNRADRIVYSADAERFMTHTERKKRTKLQLKQTLNVGSIKSESESLIGHINDGTMTDEEKNILSLFLAKEADKNSAFSVKKYSDELELPPEIAERIAPMIRKAFGVNESEELDDYGRRKFTVTDTPETTERHTKAATAFGHLGSSFTNMDSVLGSKHKLGETEDLYDEGVINDRGANSEYKWGLTDKLIRAKDRNDFYKDYENEMPTADEVRAVLANLNRGKKGKKNKTADTDSLTRRLMEMFSSSDDNTSVKASNDKPTEIKVDFKDDSNRIIEAISSSATKMQVWLERIAIGVENIESVGGTGSLIGPIQPIYDKYRDKIDSVKNAAKWGANKAFSGAKGVLAVGKGVLSVTGKFGKFLYNHTPDGPQLKTVGEQIVILSKLGFSITKLAGLYGMKAVKLALKGTKIAGGYGIDGAKYAGGKLSNALTSAKNYLGEHGILDKGKELYAKYGKHAALAAGGALAMSAGGPLTLGLGAFAVHKLMSDKGAKGGLFRNIKAIYLKGRRNVPKLSVEGLLHGEYVDKLTNTVITSAKDITGAVVNKYGETVLTTKEFLEGLVDEEGKPFSASIKDQAMKLRSVLTKENIKKLFTKENIGKFKTAKKWLTDSSPAARLKKMWAKTHVQKDLTTRVGGDPIIKAETMKLGLYIDGHTGKVINSIYQIVGSVKEFIGNDMVEVLSDLDVKNGLYDCITGKKIKLKKLSRWAINKLTGLAGKGIKGITGSGTWQKLTKLKTPVQGIASAVIDKLADTMVNKDNGVEKMLVKIYDFLKEAMPVEDSETREANRPGGAMDQMRNKHSGGLILPRERGSKDKPAAANVGSAAVGAGLIAGGAPSVLPTDHEVPPEEEEKDDDSLLGKIAGYGAAGYGAVKALGGKIPGVGRLASLGAQFGRVGTAIKAAPGWTKAVVAGGIGLTMMKESFDEVHARRLKAEGREAELIGETAMPSTLDNMKNNYINVKYKTTLTPLEKLRYLQYGIPIDSVKAVKTLRYFESEMLDIISIPDKKPPNIDMTMEDIWGSYCRVFNNNPADPTAKQNFTAWFMKRFVPVYVKHTLAARKFKCKLDDVEDINVSNGTLNDFVNLVQFDGEARKVGLDPFSIQASPFSNIPLSDNIGYADMLSNQLRDPSKIKDDILGNSKDIKDPKDIKGQAAKLAEEAKQKDIEDKAKEPSIIDKAKEMVSNTTNAVTGAVAGAYDWAKGKVNSASDAVGSAYDKARATLNDAVDTGMENIRQFNVPAAKLTGNTRDTMLNVYNAFITAGFSPAQAKALTAEVGRENGYNEKNVFGSHTDAANGAKNTGFFSWQGNRSSALLKRLASKGLLQNGAMAHSQESLNEMAAFAKEEMSSGKYPGLGNFMSDTNVDSETAAQELGNGYIKWAYGQSVLRNGTEFDWRKHDDKRAGFYKQIDSMVGGSNTDNGSKNFVSALGNYVKNGGSNDKSSNNNVSSNDCLKKYGDPQDKRYIINWTVPNDLRINSIPAAFECNKDMVGPLSQAFKNIIGRNLTGQVKSFNGCFCIRLKKSGKTMSLHSWGVAIDINAKTNGFGDRPTMSAELVKCFTDAGFDWGGYWKKPDGMHFQLASLNSNVAPASNLDTGAKTSSDSTSAPDVQSSSLLPQSSSPTQTSPLKDFSMDDSSSGGAQPIGAMASATPKPTSTMVSDTATPPANVGAIGSASTPMISADTTKAENELLGVKTQPIMAPAVPVGADVAAAVESTASIAEKQRAAQQKSLDAINNTLLQMVKTSITPAEALTKPTGTVPPTKAPYQSTTKPVTPMVDMSM